eukprot:gb/GECG01010279.1/.p1 GENE.gb/GECG01010279.1/~~gb/GECG01010279.1/.p1  ORF type:complete len:101 (+),score=25.05 gb/GECG01010279.1/:1-303(+)
MLSRPMDARGPWMKLLEEPKKGRQKRHRETWCGTLLPDGTEGGGIRAADVGLREEGKEHEKDQLKRDFIQEGQASEQPKKQKREEESAVDEEKEKNEGAD